MAQAAGVPAAGRWERWREAVGQVGSTLQHTGCEKAQIHHGQPSIGYAWQITVLPDTPSVFPPAPS